MNKESQRNNNKVMNEYYNKLYNEAVEKILSDSYQTDYLIDSPSDNRFGITILIRPDIYIKNEIQKFLDELKLAEPEQYYYPNSDIHVTVMSIISCYNGFKLGGISIADYIEVIQQSINAQKPFSINFTGLTASESCIMVKGFPDDCVLNDIRDNLRSLFKNSGLEQTIDKRYILQTAHSTVVRFQKSFTRKNDFLKVMENYRNYDFGSFKADTLELVYNDWYQRERFVKILYEFKMK